MPTTDQLLANLDSAAHAGLRLAIAWHYVMALAVVAVSFGWRPSQRLVTGLLVLPLLSVSAVAWSTHNPFNGVVFAALALVTAIGSRVASRERVTPAARWQRGVGAIALVLGWFYPHFLQDGGFLIYAYAAPTGLIPCPTLALIIGVSLLLRTAGPRWLLAVLACAGLFYGVVGVLHLGVLIDAMLAACALVLLVASARGRQPALAAHPA